MNAHIITNRTVSAGTLTRTAALGLALTNQPVSYTHLRAHETL